MEGHQQARGAVAARIHKYEQHARDYDEIERLAELGIRQMINSEGELKDD